MASNFMSGGGLSNTGVNQQFARTPSPGTDSSSAAGIAIAEALAEVDSALLNAMSNPRERMLLYQIENAVLNFVNSK